MTTAATTNATRKLLSKIILPSASLILSSQQCKDYLYHSNGNVAFCENVIHHHDKEQGEEDGKNNRNSQEVVLLKKKGVIIQKRMTPIGRFSLKTETNTNPSVPTFFIALSSPPSSTTTSTSTSTSIDNNNDSMSVSEFISTWHKRNMPSLHPRFHFKISSTKEGHFESITNTDKEESDETLESNKKIKEKNESKDTNKNSENENENNHDININDIKNHVSETLHMNVYRQDLKKRIEQLVTTVMDVKEKLWFVQISSGELGSSGAISKHKVNELKKEKSDTPKKESVLLFKCHHSMGDAVSLTAALGDLLDEAQDIRQMIEDEIRRRRKKRKDLKWWQRLLYLVQKIIWFLFGSIQALTKQMYYILTTRKNPFLVVLHEQSGDMLSCGRSISWCDVASVDEVKHVAKKLGGKKATVNDVFVSCVTAAIARQLEEHRSNHELLDDLKSTRGSKAIKKMNVVIPAHLAGGIMPPGKSVGNLIGAFVTRVPCEMEDTSSASDRLVQVHHSLDSSKRSPAPILSFLMGKFISQWVPERLAVNIFHRGSANAAVAISNSRGYENKVHINGRTVESVGGFLPLPPNIPVGVIVSSYDSVVSLSLNAEKWAVPDGDKFITWILDEYKLLLSEASQ
jgi:hypothetical protein